MILKHSHLMMVALSITLFLLRAFLLYTWPRTLNNRWLKVVPHVIDTLLLLSAIGLMLVIAQYPLTHHWLTAKVLGLVAYIGFGTMALKRARTLQGRSLALIAALLSVGYVLGVAVTRSPTLGVF
ncbi:putative membrane protein SirB2 [Marinobacterium halophilum]|uniref:Putative membrane protein SirB2 n=1 Tax=Marinobacterium halophilum TaxID=267374 RepID=A0A2P8EXW0_9GAMM|nr:SirB2 family protein [Marinobacterium halophilum]PSL14309.1 putative membrane protein SirB2 [Marinobacterium halophilum]